MTEVVVITGDVHVARRYHEQTNTQIFTARIPFLSLDQQCQSTEGKFHTQLADQYCQRMHQIIYVRYFITLRASEDAV